MAFKSPIEIRKQCMSENVESDITFIVGKDEVRIPAFRQILALSNVVFMQMLYGKFKKETEIKIPEFEPEDFKHFLNYMYFEEIDWEKVEPMNVYKIAHKYMVESLCQLCSDKMFKDIGYENAFKAMEWNEIYQDEKIYKAIKEFICPNIIGCLTINKGFKGLNQTSVMELLKWDNMRCSEDLLYENLLVWIDQQLEDQKKSKDLKNKKEILKQFLGLINLKIENDLTFRQVYTTNRHTWPLAGNFFSINSQNDMSTDTEFNFTHYNSGDIIVCFGFKILLSNLSATENLFEEFTISYWNKDMWIETSETFKIPVKNYFVVQDIILKRPFVLKNNLNFNHFGSLVTIKIKFLTDRNRLSLTVDNQRSVILNLLMETYSEKLHGIFDQTK